MKPLLLPFLACLLIAVAGCADEGAQITSYTVPKEPARPADLQVVNNGDETATPGRPVARTDRMLGAIVPDSDQTWFFKVTGPERELAAEKEEFLAFVRSIRLEEGKPKWTLPAGWRQQPASGMRFATLLVGPEDKPWELTVIPLPTSPGPAEEALLANVNRWRGQLGLPPTTADQLTSPDSQEVEQLEVDGRTVTVIDLVGEVQPGSMAPFASGRPFGGSE